MPARSVRAAIVILVVGGALRFWGIAGQGLLFYDEALQALQGKFLCITTKNFIAAPPHPQAPPKHPPAIGKPGHIAFIAIAMGLLGPIDWAGKLVSALFGTLTLWVLYRFGRARGDPAAGVIAMSFLAASGLHLAYSREGLAEADTTFFFLVAVWLAWKSRARAENGEETARWGLVALAGLSAGAAMVCNYRSIVFVGFFFATEALPALTRRRSPGWLPLRRLALLLGAFLVIPFACEGVYVLLRAFGHARGITSYFEDLAFYYAQLADRTKLLDGGGGDPRFLLGYLRGLWLTEGPFHLLMIPVGVIALARSRHSNRITLIALALGPLLFHGLYRGGGLRFLSLSLPFLALAKAEGVIALLRRRPGWLRAPGWIALAIGAISIPWLAAPLAVSSPFRRAIAETEALRRPGGIVSSRYYITEFYAPQRALFPPDSEWELFQMYRKGARYFLVDNERFAGGYHGALGELAFDALLRRIRETQAPLLEFDNPLATYPQYLMESTVQPQSFDSLRAEIARSPRMRTVKIYSLGRLFEGQPDRQMRARAIAEYQRRLTSKEGLTVGRVLTYMEQLGYLFGLEGELDGAIGAYEELLKYAPDSEVAHFNLGLLYERKGQPEAALTHYEQLIRPGAGDAQTRERMAAICERLGRPEEAARHREAAGHRPP